MFSAWKDRKSVESFKIYAISLPSNVYKVFPPSFFVVCYIIIFYLSSKPSKCIECGFSKELVKSPGFLWLMTACKPTQTYNNIRNTNMNR